MKIAYSLRSVEKQKEKKRVNKLFLYKLNKKKS